MFTAQEYFYGWLIYLTAAVGGLIVWWFLTRRIPAGIWRDILRLSGAVVLLMPYSIGEGYGYLAPAIMMTLVDGILIEDASFARAGIPLLVGWCLTLLLYFALRTGWQRFRASRQHAKSDGSALARREAASEERIEAHAEAEPQA